METDGVLSKDVRGFMTTYNEARGRSTNIDNILRSIIDAKIVHKEKVDDNRWWYDEDRVAKIDGRYLLYPWAISTRDMSAQESGWCMDLSYIRFVTPVEKTIVVYE